KTFGRSGRLSAIAIATMLGSSVLLDWTMAGPSFAAARKYYLTKATFAGDAAATACDPGYHMASRWEVVETTALQYDTRRGITAADSGSGPPTEEFGWIRTGYRPILTGGPGVSNCLAWSSGDPGVDGTYAGIGGGWGVDTAPFVNRWAMEEGSCGTPHHVWCV